MFDTYYSPTTIVEHNNHVVVQVQTSHYLHVSVVPQEANPTRLKRVISRSKVLQPRLAPTRGVRTWPRLLKTEYTSNKYFGSLMISSHKYKATDEVENQKELFIWPRHNIYG